MKGSFFKDGIEYRIEIQGESWLQGSRVNGTLVVRNHGNKPFEGVSALAVRLALGTERKVKAKQESAFVEIGSSGALAAGAEALAAGATSLPLPWEFALPETARITDATKSLYITYGPGELAAAAGTFGALQLRVLPHPWIEDLCSIIDTNYRFPRRKISAADDKSGAVEIKFDAPDARSFSAVESLVAEFRVIRPESEPAPTTIESSYTFQIKEVDAMKAGLQLKKGKRTATRTLDPRELILKLNNRVRRDVFEGVFASVLAEANLSPGG